MDLTKLRQELRRLAEGAASVRLLGAEKLRHAPNDCVDTDEWGRPDWVVCIQHTHAARGQTAWCGRPTWPRFVYQNIDHAAYSVMNEDRLQPCKECVAAVVEMLNRTVAPVGEKEKG